MKEHPILFSGPMVRAILDGRKSQTRRTVKPQPPADVNRLIGPELYEPMVYDSHGDCYPGKAIYGVYDDYPCCDYGVKCPWQPGDRLWVRETFADLRGMGFGNDPVTDKPWNFAYKADIQPGSDSDQARIDYGVKWKPSIHMPRAASRITLEVTDVRVERLQEILCGDMKREGCIPPTVTGGQYQQWQRDYWIPLWDAINAKRGYGWDVNPWVWVIEFKAEGE